MTKTKVTKERVIYLLREGYQRQDIAKMLGIGRNTLWRYMKKWGMTKDTVADLDHIVLTHMREQGMTWDQIAENLGVTRRHIFRVRRTLEEKTGVLIP